MAEYLKRLRNECHIYAWKGYEDWQDPRSTGGTSGLAITADWLTRPLELKSDARYVVVVEKDGVFNRIVEDGFFDRQANHSLLLLVAW